MQVLLELQQAGCDAIGADRVLPGFDLLLHRRNTRTINVGGVLHGL